MIGWHARQTMNHKNLNPWLVILLLLATAGVFLPSKLTAAPLSWQQLPPREKMILRPYASIWPDLSLEKREKLRHGAGQWSRMSEKARTQARESFKQWQQFTPAERQRIRQQFEKFRRLPSAERRRLLVARRFYLQQSEEQRRQLRERWQKSEDANPSGGSPAASNTDS